VSISRSTRAVLAVFVLTATAIETWAPLATVPGVAVAEVVHPPDVDAAASAEVFRIATMPMIEATSVSAINEIHRRSRTRA